MPVLDLDAFLFDVILPVQLPSPHQMLDRIQLQEVLSYFASSNGEQVRRHSELLSQSRHAFDGQVYMVYGASAAATALRHSRPESFNDITRQHIDRPDRILRDLQFPVPAFWPMADSGATVNVVWDTELIANFRAQSHALRGFQGMTSFAIGEDFLMFLCLRMFKMKGGLLNISLQVTMIPGLCLMPAAFRWLRLQRCHY